MILFNYWLVWASQNIYPSNIYIWKISRWLETTYRLGSKVKGEMTYLKKEASLSKWRPRLSAPKTTGNLLNISTETSLGEESKHVLSKYLSNNKRKIGVYLLMQDGISLAPVQPWYCIKNPKLKKKKLKVDKDEHDEGGK